MLTKHFGAAPADAPANVRYSPTRITGTTREVITRSPDMRFISTSHVERQNLSMRMGMRRFTRLTNGFSRKVENHIAANALHFLHYNFARIHRTLRVTPAMAAGISDHASSVEEIVSLLNTARAVAA